MVVELAVLQQGFAKHYYEGGAVGEGEGCARGMVRQPSHLPSIYRGKGEGGWPPLDGSRGGARGWLAPQAKGGAPFRVSPKP